MASFESEHLNKITEWVGAEVARAGRRLGMSTVPEELTQIAQGASYIEVTVPTSRDKTIQLTLAMRRDKGESPFDISIHVNTLIFAPTPHLQHQEVLLDTKGNFTARGNIGKYTPEEFFYDKTNLWFEKLYKSYRPVKVLFTDFNHDTHTYPPEQDTIGGDASPRLITDYRDMAIDNSQQGGSFSPTSSIYDLFDDMNNTTSPEADEYIGELLADDIVQLYRRVLDESLRQSLNVAGIDEPVMKLSLKTLHMQPIAELKALLNHTGHMLEQGCEIVLEENGLIRFKKRENEANYQTVQLDPSSRKFILTGQYFTAQPAAPYAVLCYMQNVIKLNAPVLGNITFANKSDIEDF